jgi:hypothetical protein
MRAAPAAEARSNDPLAYFAAILEADTAAEAMRLCCQQLLDENGQKHGPVSLGRLLAALGARDEVRPLSTEGKLKIDKEGYLICVREGIQWERRRFTVAHELGHILLCEALKDRPQALRALQDRSQWKAVERLCDQAAAELLMPADDFHRQLKGREISQRLLHHLKERYGVSWTALLIRFNELLGFGVSSWSRHQRHPEERVTFRVEKCWGSGASWLPKGLTTRYLQPDVVNRAAVDGDAAGRGVLAFGGKSSEVFSVAVAIETSRESPYVTPTLEGVEPSPPDPLNRKVFLFLRTMEDEATPEGGEKLSSVPQQLALLT